MQSKDTDIQDDFVQVYRSKLASRFEECLADEPSTFVTITVKLQTDGTPASAKVPFANPAIAHSKCLTTAIEETRFAPAKRANEVTMLCTWKK